MARALSQREKNVIIGAGIFLVCFVLYWFIILPKREDLRDLKESVEKLRAQHQEVERIRAQHNLLKKETDPVMQKILQRKKDFDLSAFVAETEKLQKITRNRETTLRPTTYGNFEKQTSVFTYEDNSLYQIVEFLKEIEKPENVISIESLTIRPKSAADPSRLNLEIRLATLVPAGRGK